MSKNVKKNVKEVKNVAINVENDEQKNVKENLDTTPKMPENNPAPIEEIDPDADACEFAKNKLGISPKEVLAILDVYKASYAKYLSLHRITRGNGGPTLLNEAIRILAAKMSIENSPESVIGMRCNDIIDALKKDEIGKTLSCFVAREDGKEKTPSNSLYTALLNCYRKTGKVMPSMAKGYWIISKNPELAKKQAEAEMKAKNAEEQAKNVDDKTKNVDDKAKNVDDKAKNVEVKENAAD